jgi:hypothetical protein
MASGYVDTLLNALPADMKRVLTQVFEYTSNNWKVGTGPRATNAQWYRFESTTASVANTEFTVRHGLGAAPHTLIPVLDVTQTGASLVPLTVTRAADAERLYLASSSTSVAVTFFLEA